jgi:hypothetical protein
MRNDRLIEIVVFTGISLAGSFLFVWTIFFHCPLTIGIVSFYQ